MRVVIVSDRPCLYRCNLLKQIIEERVGGHVEIAYTQKEVSGEYDIVIVHGDKSPGGYITKKQDVPTAQGRHVIGHWTGASQPGWFNKLVDTNYTNMIELRDWIEKQKGTK